jgi:hypothetical protein
MKATGGISEDDEEGCGADATRSGTEISGVWQAGNTKGKLQAGLREGRRGV